METLGAWLADADRVYAADGAADLCRAAGREADVVVGDFDSISIEAREGARDLRRRPDQNLTDADKVLAEITADGWKEATVCGLEGDLPDHELAALGSCLTAFDRDALSITLRYRRGRAWFVSHERPFQQELEAGTRLSLMPMEPADGIDLEGVIWPLENARLGICGIGSISNRAAGGIVRATVRSGVVWLFIADEAKPGPPTSGRRISRISLQSG